MHLEIQDITNIIQDYKHDIYISGSTTSAIFYPKRKTWMKNNNRPAKKINAAKR
jgi:hypothetical protein